ncbi:MAG TPA: arginine deiminase-related protein [Cyclobacteriaceae bacterium]|nr:arginine deiminase-related protein [Cyclobacteriaceae bacterium]
MSSDVTNKITFRQVPHGILMVRPVSFGFNPETAGSNSFQRMPDISDDVPGRARSEFDAVVQILKDKGVKVMVVEDTAEPVTTDAVFPNNWITTHEDGKIILYPMMAPSRRKERRHDIVEMLQAKYDVTIIIDFTEGERSNKFLEGTGSLIFDHVNRIAYACRSPRTDETLLNELCKTIGYTPLLFGAVDESGVPIYHTNVMMWLGERVAGICLDSIRTEADQELVLGSLASTGHKVIALSFQQMNSFAGNMFEVRNDNDERFLLMSQTAYDSLLPGQILEIEKYCEPLVVPISTIEESGGGSIRCMVAGIHLPLSKT